MLSAPTRNVPHKPDAPTAADLSEYEAPNSSANSPEFHGESTTRPTSALYSIYIFDADMERRETRALPLESDAGRVDEEV